jgi:HSP20 family protein
VEKRCTFLNEKGVLEMAIGLMRPSMLSRRLWDSDDWSEDFPDVARYFSPLLSDTGFVPSMESFVKDHVLHLRAEIPGVDPSDVNVSFNDGHLCVTGERRRPETAEKACYCTEEMSYGSFSRCFHVPGDVDAGKVHAKYDNGMLEITLPLSESTKGTKIPIEGVKSEQGTLKSG